MKLLLWFSFMLLFTDASGSSAARIHRLQTEGKSPDARVLSLPPNELHNGRDANSFCKIGIKVAGQKIVHSLNLIAKYLQVEKMPAIQGALKDCQMTLNNAIFHLNASMIKIIKLRAVSIGEEDTEDLRTWLSAALTDQTTCSDSLDSISKNSSNDEMKKNVHFLKQQLRNMLAVFATSQNDAIKKINGRKLSTLEPWVQASFPYKLLKGFPDWLPLHRRNLLQADFLISPNVVVAKDGAGHYRKVQDAVDEAPNNSPDMFLIYIRAGTYEESVTVNETQINLVFLGDGIGKTIISGSKNVLEPGTTTFGSATVAINGRGFIARNLSIQNTAGPEKNQAVALRVSADQSVFYKCGIWGYQDTLFAHSQRQFYRECEIGGTIDFIFGNAAAAFQACNIVARVPLTGQNNTYTAHGRTDPHQNTGFSFQGCLVDGTPDLKSSISTTPTFLGRPWKDYSRTVFMQSELSAVVNSAGWIQWDDRPESRLCGVFFGEFENRGKGSDRSGRVNWSIAMSPQQATDFTVESFINGAQWLPVAQIPYNSTL